MKNTNPTCFHFQSSFKSLIINNLISSHSVGANCQTDNCENLTNLKQLLTLNAVFNSNPKEINYPKVCQIPIKQNYIIPPKSKLALTCQAYVTGAIVNQVKKKNIKL